MKLLTYQQAVAECPPNISEDRLRRAASPKTPLKKRLLVKRVGHRTVLIRDVDLRGWLERIA